MVQRTFIRVNTSFDETGYMLPEAIVWKDRFYPVEEVRFFNPADPGIENDGGLVQCYTVRINGEEKHLFFEKLRSARAPRYGKWFVLTRT